MQVSLVLYPVLVVGGLAVALYGLLGKKPFYNDVEMPLTQEEKEDTRPPTKSERAGYIGFGIVLVFVGLWKLASPG